uniref:Tripartite motif containing 16 n=1 Tax=Nothobranchius furzeri TaxID=105023 RepID=A0A8C6KIW4_NOTFU
TSKRGTLLGSEGETKMDSVKFSCCICLDLLKDPVTIPCGHSYCMSCVKAHWDGGDQRRIYSCPQCRQTFRPRPVLVKNTMLAELVEELTKTGLGAAPADLCYAGPEDVSCDVCSGRKLKAVKSCLVCLVSYCEEHLQPHHCVAPLRRHKLVDPSEKLQENISCRHDEFMKMLMDEFETISVTAERAEKQKELQARRQQIQQRIQERQKDVELLQQEVEDINVSADKTVEDSEETFTQLIRLMQERSSDVKQQVRSQQETEVRRVKELQEKLEQEITELKRKDAELEQLSHTEDHKQFLHNYPSVSALSGSPHSSSINVRPRRHFEDVTAAVSALRDVLQDVLRDRGTNVSLRGTAVDGLLPEPEPKTRSDFLKHLQEITMDPNTAFTSLLLSDGNRKVKVTNKQIYPDHPDRFTFYDQVLSGESLTGRCYWEVEWSGDAIHLAVAHKNISRDGTSDECAFGFNDKSWALKCCGNGYSFCHNNVKTPVSGPGSSRIGVYLDHGAGILCFYSVSDTMTLLHREETTSKITFFLLINCIFGSLKCNISFSVHFFTCLCKLD